MNDRELLELAANAAGIEYEWHQGCGDALCLTATDAKSIYWNPLKSDADAMRLSIALRLKVYHAPLAVMAEHQRFCHEWIGELVDDDNGDRYAATRRAIVRAAAEIGRAMP